MFENLFNRSKSEASNFKRFDEYLDTLMKLSPLKEKAKFHYALFSENGFDEKIEADSAENGTRLYSLEQIVNY